MSKSIALPFNRAKRNGTILNIKISDTYIKFVESMRCLAITLDNKLNFSLEVVLTLRRLDNPNAYLLLTVKFQHTHTLTSKKIIVGRNQIFYSHTTVILKRQKAKELHFHGP